VPRGILCFSYTQVCDWRSPCGGLYWRQNKL